MSITADHLPFAGSLSSYNVSKHYQGNLFLTSNVFSCKMYTKKYIAPKLIYLSPSNFVLLLDLLCTSIIFSLSRTRYHIADTIVTVYNYSECYFRWFVPIETVHIAKHYRGALHHAQFQWDMFYTMYSCVWKHQMK